MGRQPAAQVTITSALVALLLSFFNAAQASTEDVWVFCGPNMSDPVVAQRTLESYADNGVDVVFGECLAPDWASYSPAFPRQRYAPPETYMGLVKLAAPLGLRVVVYDERVWSPDPFVRVAAERFWRPVAHHIAAWDMGDEFDPDGREWPLLVERWNLVRATSSIAPFTNHLWWALDDALRDLPGSGDFTSFDRYDADRGVSVAQGFAPAVRSLMCAVNAYDHGPFIPNVAADRVALAAAGCDKFLIFGGPPLDGVPDFEEASLVDAHGYATNRLEGVGA